jgi:predicted SnoaL-like aldol condensation-catalyzing enzyme
MTPPNTTNRKDIAIEFLRLLRTGNREGAERLTTRGARHHNPYFNPGMSSLIAAAALAAHDAPDRTADVKRVIAGDDHVVVHSHVRHKPGDAGVSVVHIFRFEGDHIAELWDVGQVIPGESPNTDGMF